MSHGLITSPVSTTTSLSELKKPNFLMKSKASQLEFRLKKQSGSSTIRATIATIIGVHVKKDSFYDLLGIPETGTLSEIKQAYKKLARKYHPDVSPPDRTKEYTKMFIQVQEAYETLSDPQTRALYDRNLAAGLHLAFNARKQFRYNEGLSGKEEWQNRWMSQLEELKRRRDIGDHSRESVSREARMRSQNPENTRMSL